MCVTKKWLATSVSHVPSRSRFQYFPGRFHYFPSHVTPTFQLLVPELSRFYITVPKLSRSVPILSNSEYQNFPDYISWYQNFPHRFQYFPTPRTNTFQVVYHGTKTFQIGSNTFQLTVPKLSNSWYQNFPTF